MPFISETNTRATLQQFGRYEFQPETDFGETFAASVGQVIDEELSISTMLNREGYETRNRLIDERIKTGEIDAEPYRKRVTGRPGQATSEQVDYGRIAQDLNDPNIKPDSVLHQERNEMLRQRREYAQGVQERGSGTAQFLGAMTGYMLDPLNIATVGIAAPITVGKSLTTLGRVALAARNAALVEGAVELGIQGFVYAHKKDIDSPYSAGDALANIAFAAGGAAVVGGAAAGVSGWLRRVIGYSKELPPSKDVDASLAYLERMAATLESAEKSGALPDIDRAGIEAKALAEARSEILGIQDSVLRQADEELMPIAGEVLSRGDLKALRAEKNHLEYELTQVQKPTPEDFAEAVAKVKAENPRMKARAQKEEARRLVDGAYAEEVDVFKSRLAIIERKISLHETAAEARADLARIDQGIIPVKYQKIIHQRISEALVKRDVDFIQELDKRAQEYAGPQKTAEMYAEPPTTRKPAPQTISARERDYLESNGLTEAYDADLEAYRALENPLIEIDGEQINAADIMKEFDDELAGLESVLTCVIGEAA